MTPLTPQATVDRVVRATRTAAVVGMKDESKASAPAHWVPAAMAARGIAVVPVNPTIREALGVPALAAVADLAARPEPVDVVVVFRLPDVVGGIADEVLALPEARRPRAFWMQLGIDNADAAARLEAAGITVVQDRCFAVEMNRR